MPPVIISIIRLAAFFWSAARGELVLFGQHERRHVRLISSSPPVADNSDIRPWEIDRSTLPSADRSMKPMRNAISSRQATFNP